MFSGEYVADLHILQLTGTTTGGAGRHAQDLTRGLRAAGHRVVLAGPADVIETVSAPTAVVDIAERPRPSDLQVIRRIRAVATGAQIVHAHGLRAGALAALALLGRHRAALVVTLHNKPVGAVRVRLVGGLLQRLVARRAQVILGVSGDLVANARRLGAAHAERALVPAPFPPGTQTGPADPDRLRTLRRELGLPDQAPVVLTLARLAPQKGLGLLTETAALLAEQVPTAHWLVAGGGPLHAELEQQARQEGVPLHVLGHRDDAEELLALADVVVSTSSWEGQPLNLQEALRAGRPIVATDVGGTGEVTGDAAHLVPYGDAADLAGRITAVLTDPDLAAELSRAARRRAGELPSRADTLEQVERCYLQFRPSVLE